MFRRFLKSFKKKPTASTPDLSDGPYAFHMAGERLAWQRHFQILYGTTRIGDLDYVDLFWSCAHDTDTEMSRRMVFRRAQAGLNLVRYFLEASTLPGARAECGVFRGMSSLLLCRAERATHPGFDGSGLFLFDSFERFSEPTEFDMIQTTDERGETAMQRPFPANSRLKTSLDEVKHALAEFPALEIRQGWLPGTLQQLPERTWSFVHLDVDLYEPTLGGLEYFYPRLCPGGIIITDDYATPRYPGARKAWERFCESNDVPYLVLGGTAQAVIIRAPERLPKP